MATSLSEKEKQSTLLYFLKLYGETLSESLVKEAVDKHHYDMAACLDELEEMVQKRKQGKLKTSTEKAILRKEAEEEEKIAALNKYRVVKINDKFSVVEKGAPPTIRYLKENGISINDLFSIQILQEIFKYIPRRDRLRILLVCKVWCEAGLRAFDPSERNNWAICWACWTGKVNKVKDLLVDPRVNPADRNSHALIFACQKGHSVIVQLLLNDGRVDPSAQDNEALLESIKSNHPSITKLLLQDPRVKISSRHLEAAKQSEEITNLLLSYGDKII